MQRISTALTWIFLFCFNLLGYGGNGQPLVIENYPKIEQVTESRIQLLEIANSQVGVRELTGNNDGIEVETYQNAVNIPKGSAWCVAFVVWCHLQICSDFPIPITGWSPALFNRNLVYHKNHIRISEWIPRGGEVFAWYSRHKKRIAHAGIIEKKWSKHYHTIEGNTSLMGAITKALNLSDSEIEQLQREGIWVVKKIRKPGEIYAAADYIGFEEIEIALKNQTINDENKLEKQN